MLPRRLKLLKTLKETYQINQVTLVKTQRTHKSLPPEYLVTRVQTMKTLVLPLLIVLSACGKQSKLTYSESAGGSFPIDQAVSFNQLKADVFTPHCIRCHSNASTERGLQSWVVAGKPDSSPLFQRTEDGSMPKNDAPLSTRDLEEIRAYITNLLPGATTPTSPPTSGSVTFSEIKSQVLTPFRCTSCHSMSTESAVARYINKSNPDQSSLYTSVQNGSMPKGGSRVSPAKQALLLKYVRDYASSH